MNIDISELETLDARDERKERRVDKACFWGAVVGLAITALVMLAASGCAMERADPAARSNRATYTITVNAAGGSTVTAYVADGLMATADGEGAITQPSTLTTTQSPEITVPGDAVSAGIQAAGHVVGKIVDAKAAKAADCPSGASPEAGCGNGGCQGGGCIDGNCAVK